MPLINIITDGLMRYHLGFVITIMTLLIIVTNFAN